MARSVDWFQRLPQILALLEEPGHPQLLNRQGIQDLFGVERRNAQYLLTRFGAARFGNALCIERAQLANALRELATQDGCVRQIQRHQNVRTVLADRRVSLKLARITLPPSSNSLGQLPSTIQFEPGCLSIEFSGAVDLLGQLLELSRAIGDDFERFEALLNRDPLLD